MPSRTPPSPLTSTRLPQPAESRRAVVRSPLSPGSQRAKRRPQLSGLRAESATASLWRDTQRCYRAVAARDSRFDGQFITAVRTTGIYCRPSCPAPTPKPENVRFYPTSAAAQAGGFRACRRCLPDAVPGSPTWNIRADLAGRAMRLISDGTVERAGVSGLARELGYSERQLARVLTAELGAGPLALARAHRAHSARLLIELTELPLADVAFAAGFASIRQFNDTIREIFVRTPSQLRAEATAARQAGAGEARRVSNALRLSLRLPYRSPFDSTGIFEFLAARTVAGVETASYGPAGVTGYGRTLRLPHGWGVMWLSPGDQHVRCDMRLSDIRDVGAAVARARRLLDLDADPQAIFEVLKADAAMAHAVSAQPGIRLPGAIDGSEMLVRAMFGQQVSVAAARAAITTMTATLGERLPEIAAEDGPLSELTTLFPTPEVIAERGHEVLRGPSRRIESMVIAATALATGDLEVHLGRDNDELAAELRRLPGIGPWTAGYVVMRVLNAPDILLDGDVALRKGARTLGIPDDPAGLSKYAERWRPWRSYAGLYLWRASVSDTFATATGKLDPAITRSFR